MMLKTSATRPTVANSAPPLSIAGASGCEDSGTKRAVPTSATTARTTLTAKAALQEKKCRRIPEQRSPKMALPPATAAQIPTAFVRSAGGKVPVIVDKVAGITKAAPSPIRPRRKISSLGEDTAIAAADAAPKTMRPPMSALRRP
jgi:hypothetical protein